MGTWLESFFLFFRKLFRIDRFRFRCEHCDMLRYRVCNAPVATDVLCGVPARRVRIEVDVKEELLEAVRERYHLTSPRAAIEFALRRAAVRPMSKEEALAMEGVGWDGNLDAMRSGDPGAPW